MHTINYVPQRRDDTALDALSWVGDSMTINGEILDLSGIPEGATLPGDAVEHPLIIGKITRNSNALSLSVILPIGADASDAEKFPAPVISGDGPVSIPGKVTV